MPSSRDRKSQLRRSRVGPPRAAWARKPLNTFGTWAAPDPVAGLLMADAFPPAVFGLLGMVGWVPTIELTVHLRARPAAGWLLGQFVAEDLRDGIARLRAKIKYRPVFFELMPPEFTLTDLQATVEAISGRHLHKQNFRRLVEGAELVEPTGMSTAATGGRPAALFRFRRQILDERPAPGLKV